MLYGRVRYDMNTKAKEEKMHRRQLLKKQVCARWQIYLLLALPLTYILIFAYVPMGGLVLAFKDYDMTKGIWGSEFVGLANFREFFESYKFRQVLTNTLTVSVYSLLVTFPIPILFALILNALPGKRFGKLVQTTTYIPYFISTVVMVGLVMQVLNYRTGIYGSVYSLITGTAAPDIIGKASAFKHIYVWSAVWQTTGYSAIIYIAALAGVDQSLHEAARIDGASRFQRVLYVDWPSIQSTATIMLILAAGNIMNVGFEKVLLLQNDLNIASSEVISTYVYKVGLARGIGDFSLSTAIGMFNSVINFILLMTVNRISKRMSGNGIF